MKPYISKDGTPLTLKAMKGERKARLFPNGFEATIPCKRCGKPFDSTDRRSVRHCDPCRTKLTAMTDTYGSGGEYDI